MSPTASCRSTRSASSRSTRRRGPSTCARTRSVSRADFAFAPTSDGYTWEIAAGPTTIRYTAVIKDGTLREVGDRIVPGRDPLRFFEMTLQRIGDSDWPSAGATGPK